MGTDLATVLATFAVLANGDIETTSFYLGSGKNGIGGLNRHSTVEADVSPTREDYYTGCGDNHHLSSRLVKQLVKYANQDPKKEFSMNVMASSYAETAGFSKNYNPFLYYFPFPQIVSLGAFAFYPQFFSNGTYGAGGVANAKSILSIIGAEFDKSTGEFKYVPEKWPENWYRRATPYGAVQALTDGFLQIYPRNIIVPGASQVGTPNLSVQTLLCDVYQGINSVTPLILGAPKRRLLRLSPGLLVFLALCWAREPRWAALTAPSRPTSSTLILTSREGLETLLLLRTRTLGTMCTTRFTLRRHLPALSARLERGTNNR